ncbi:ribose 5-phosphate isomerase B [Bittarella massiliensis (ex Durand et al. 2017)]|uniref:ribose 5-phosphate isomerase B n=1 Tax=Bittarella massiliensis (ex Durand et al. 2017) TaxID=1720313 RepID=UPI001AA0D186|nr:ribose 5-phosphate isomerase B [Bittarella massiliensis (ex Durand et al. 2017)]MBO1678577.1 ribose 5-phosphate isomerase B [Bittarella massiliensis (ex Durand et al. 2017)]
MLAIGCDHGGYDLKEEVKKHLDERGIEYIDCGCNGESVDYPVIASETCAHITSGECEMGLLFCGTGIGISIAANKTPGIRAACCSDYYSAKYTRMHNNANVLCMGGRVISSGLACELVDVFLDTAFEGGRHQRRIDMLTELDKKKQ